MSKSNRIASRVTLASSNLDGYNGPLDVIRRGRRRWWHRLLRRPPPALHVRRVHGDVRDGVARLWSRR